MTLPSRIKKQIDDLVGLLIDKNLSVLQNFAVLRGDDHGECEVSFPDDDEISIALRSRPYGEIFRELVENNAFTVMMKDKALIQMMYMFVNGELVRHRLAFFPAPAYDQWEFDFYGLEIDESFSDSVDVGLVPFPIRFDFDGRAGVVHPPDHPKSHVTLGQYKGCRIPVTAPVTPSAFLNFVIRNFYHSDFPGICNSFPDGDTGFPESIRPVERETIHVSIPANSLRV